MKKIGLNAIKTRPHLIAKFPHLFQPGGGFPHLDQILDLTLGLHVSTDQYIFTFWKILHGTINLCYIFFVV